MIKLRLLFLLIIIPITMFSQIRGTIVDKKTGKPVEYANIWVENQNIGTTSDQQGNFSFKENVLKKTLLISVIGYESLQTIIEHDNLKIELNPKTYLINEITIRPMKRKELIIDKFRKSSINHHLMCESRPWIVAKYFKYSPIYEETPLIKDLSINTKSKINDATFNLRIISANEKGEPTDDILKENLIVKAEKGNRKLFVDLTDFQIIFPKNGFFVCVESLILESNKSEFVYTIAGSKKKIHSVQYNPKFGMVLIDENISSWVFVNGKWRNIQLKPKADKKSQELAIELTLTD